MVPDESFYFFYAYVNCYNNFIISISEAKLNFLKNHLEPLKTVKAYWTETYETRRNILHVRQVAVHEYIQQFAYIKLQDGQKLVSIMKIVGINQISNLKQSF